jgi:hypothetical protein
MQLNINKFFSKDKSIFFLESFRLNFVRYLRKFWSRTKRDSAIPAIHRNREPPEMSCPFRKGVQNWDVEGSKSRALDHERILAQQVPPQQAF